MVLERKSERKRNGTKGSLNYENMGRGKEEYASAKLVSKAHVKWKHKIALHLFDFP